MSTKAKGFVILLMVILLNVQCDLKAQTVNPTGTWKAEIIEPTKDLFCYTYFINWDGVNLTGKISSEYRAPKNKGILTDKIFFAFMNGKIKGDSIYFEEYLKFMDNRSKHYYSGKISGDSINCIRKFGGYEEGKFINISHVVLMRDKPSANN